MILMEVYKKFEPYFVYKDGEKVIRDDAPEEIKKEWAELHKTKENEIVNY